MSYGRQADILGGRTQADSLYPPSVSSMAIATFM